MVRIHLWISGFVQGVCYRHYTSEMAKSLGLTGWVRNLPDGCVEVIAEGNRETLEILIKWCRQGPSRARVERVEMEWDEYTGEFDRFFVTH